MAPSYTRLMLFGSLVLILAFVAQKVYLSEEEEKEEEECSAREQSTVTPSSCCPRIMYGEPSKTKYPWIVSLHGSGEFFKYKENSKEKLYDSFNCAGSLISHRWILTAAHCLYINEGSTQTPKYRLLRNNEILVNFGGVNLRVNPEADQIRSVKKVLFHKKYKADRFRYDIGLLELDQPVTKFSAAIRPIVLPEEPFHPEDIKEFLLTGWGWTEMSNCTSEVLKEVKIDHVTRTECAKIRKERILEHMMCAGKREGNKYLDGNAGDSGGGLVYLNSENEYIIAGIVSFGHRYTYEAPNGPVCEFESTRDQPGVYTQVSKFLNPNTPLPPDWSTEGA